MISVLLTGQALLENFAAVFPSAPELMEMAEKRGEARRLLSKEPAEASSRLSSLSLPLLLEFLSGPEREGPQRAGQVPQGLSLALTSCLKLGSLGNKFNKLGLGT